MIEENAQLLNALAQEHDVPEELAEAMSALMDRYTDLSPWGSKAALRQDLEKVIDAAFRNKLVTTE